VRNFQVFVAIDWSGAVGPRQPGIAVAICTTGRAAPELVRPDQVWSRLDVLEWLKRDLPKNALVGLDLGASLAFADSDAFFPGAPDNAVDACGLWALIDDVCAGDPNLGASSFVDHAQYSRHFRRHGGRTGEFFPAGRGRLRVTEEAQRAQGLNPYSNFNLVGAAQVGKSSLTGMRLLHRLRDHVPVWPFDQIPETGPLIVEIYTSLAAVAAGLRKSRTKMRDGKSLDIALANLGAEPHAPLPRYTDHATDAILTSAWLRKVADDPALWNPPGLEAVRYTEGWTFGVR
jgi:hypothetical protein